MTSLLRSHYCGRINEDDIGKATVMGWVQRTVIWVCICRLRDRLDLQV